MYDPLCLLVKITKFISSSSMVFCSQTIHHPKVTIYKSKLFFNCTKNETTSNPKSLPLFVTMSVYAWERVPSLKLPFLVPWCLLQDPPTSSERILS